jgi:hypothetical protein
MRQQGLRDRQFITMINSTLVILAATSLWHALNTLRTGVYVAAAEFSPDKEAGGEFHHRVIQLV